MNTDERIAEIDREWPALVRGDVMTARRMLADCSAPDDEFAPGAELDAEPHPHADVLGEGPNVSVTQAQFDRRFIAWCVALTLFIVGAFVWAHWEVWK